MTKQITLNVDERDIATLQLIIRKTLKGKKARPIQDYTQHTLEKYLLMTLYQRTQLAADTDEPKHEYLSTHEPDLAIEDQSLNQLLKKREAIQRRLSRASCSPKFISAESIRSWEEQLGEVIREIHVKQGRAR